MMGRCLRGANFKGPSQTRVVPVKEVRAVKLKGTNICLEGIQINLSDVARGNSADRTCLFSKV